VKRELQFFKTEMQREFDVKLERAKVEIRNQVDAEISLNKQEIFHIIKVDNAQVQNIMREQDEKIKDASDIAKYALESTINTDKLIGYVRNELANVHNLIKCDASLHKAAAEGFETALDATLARLTLFRPGVPKKIDAVIMHWKSNYSAAVLITQKIVGLLHVPVFVMCQNKANSGPVDISGVSESIQTEHHILSDNHDECKERNCECQSACPCGNCATFVQNDILKEFPVHLFLSNLFVSQEEKRQPTILLLTHDLMEMDAEVKRNSKFEIIPVHLTGSDIPYTPTHSDEINEYQQHWGHIKSAPRINGTYKPVVLKFNPSWIIDEKSTNSVFQLVNQ